ncbi:MAG: aminotransferase class I/II-fold pyridoxal phosphate-dependent enzyme [Rhodospirillaceae bacterium]
MIQVFRPNMPPAEAILPYMRRIDQRRWYSNFGPLYHELRARFAAMFGVTEDQLVLVSNATVGISLAIRAVMSQRAGGICLMPSWTFSASPLAAMAAGLQPYFGDVDRDTWALDPTQISDAQMEQASALLVVSPFGTPLNMDDWETVVQKYGVPVVCDAAASLDAVARAPEFQVTSIPIVISLHATKALGIGEGAIVLCADPDVIERVRQMSNFGFSKTSVSQVVGTNAKLSEYSCAVGLAALDRWEGVRANLLARSARYAEMLAPVDGVSLFGAESPYASTYAVAELDHRDAYQLANFLSRSGVETRRWWRSGCHGHPTFNAFPASPLPETRRLSRSTLGLPYYADISDEEMSRVVTLLGDFLASPHKREDAAPALTRGAREVV